MEIPLLRRLQLRLQRLRELRQGPPLRILPCLLRGMEHRRGALDQEARQVDRHAQAALLLRQGGQRLHEHQRQPRTLRLPARVQQRLKLVGRKHHGQAHRLQVRRRGRGHLQLQRPHILAHCQRQCDVGGVEEARCGRGPLPLRQQVQRHGRLLQREAHRHLHDTLSPAAVGGPQLPGHQPQRLQQVPVGQCGSGEEQRLRRQLRPQTEDRTSGLHLPRQLHLLQERDSGIRRAVQPLSLLAQRRFPCEPGTRPHRHRTVQGL